MCKSIWLVGLWLGITCSLTAQNEGYLPNGERVGGWRSYLSHREVNDVVATPDGWLLMATTGGYAAYNPANNQLYTATRIDGLAGVNPNTLYYQHATRQVFLAYPNGLVDVFPRLEAHQRTTIVDLSLTQNYSDKRINSLVVFGDSLFLCTQFGVVVYDQRRRESRATWTQFGQRNEPATFTLRVLNDSIYVGNTGGLYSAPLAGSNLADGASWQWLNAQPGSLVAGACKGLAVANGIVYGLVDTGLVQRTPQGVWQTLPDSAFGAFPPQTTTRLVQTETEVLAKHGGTLLRLQPGGSTGLAIDQLWNYPSFGVLPGTGQVFRANALGLVLDEPQSGTRVPLANLLPVSNKVVDVEAYPGRVAVGSSRETPTGGTFDCTYDESGAYLFDIENRTVQHVAPGSNSVPTGLACFGTVAYHPATGEFLSGPWNFGLVSVRNGAFHTVYDSSNSLLQGALEDPQGRDYYIRVSGLRFDAAGTLWASTYRPFATTRSLAFRTPDDTWYQGLPLPNSDVLGLLMDRNGRGWLRIRDGGLVVYDNAGTPETSTDDQLRQLGTSVGQGKLVSQNTTCLAEDRQGNIWVGTDIGISVFYNAANILTPGTGTDAGCPIVGGRCLLNDASITAIAVDGANRKWVGTSTSGVLLISADGTQQLQEFDVSNSPLPSNNITDLAVEPRTGEVFIATDAGLVSYIGTAPEPYTENVTLTAFPNPLYLNQDIPLSVRGTTESARVRILTPAGQLVRELESTGGQATWDGRDVQGQLAVPGVYVVQAIAPDGTSSGVTKVAVLAQ